MKQSLPPQAAFGHGVHCSDRKHTKTTFNHHVKWQLKSMQLFTTPHTSLEVQYFKPLMQSARFTSYSLVFPAGDTLHVHVLITSSETDLSTFLSVCSLNVFVGSSFSRQT